MREESEDFKTASQKQLVIVVLMEYIGLFFKLPVVMNQGGGGPNKSLKRWIEKG